MSGRGRRAVLPPADHRTEPPTAPDRLVVTLVNKAGHKQAYDFADLPVAEPVQRSLAAAFAAQSGPWNSHRTAGNHWGRLLVFARFLSGLEHPPQDLSELTAATLKRWRAQHISTNYGRSTLRTEGFSTTTASSRSRCRAFLCRPALGPRVHSRRVLCRRWPAVPRQSSCWSG